MGSVCVCVLMRALLDASVITFEILNNLTSFTKFSMYILRIQVDLQATKLAFLNLLNVPHAQSCKVSP